MERTRWTKNERVVHGPRCVIFPFKLTHEERFKKQSREKKTVENKEATQSVLFSSPTHTFFLDFG